MCRTFPHNNIVIVVVVIVVEREKEHLVRANSVCILSQPCLPKLPIQVSLTWSSVVLVVILIFSLSITLFS